METRYYYDKRHYQPFGNLTEVRGKVTKQSFMVKSTYPIFGSATWDIRIPLGNLLFEDRTEAVEFLKKQLVYQLRELKEEIDEAEEFLSSGA